MKSKFFLSFFSLVLIANICFSQNVRSVKALTKKQSTSFTKLRNAKSRGLLDFEKELDLTLAQAYNLNSSSGLESIFEFNFEGSYNSSFHKGKFTILNYGEYEISFVKEGPQNFIKNEDLLSITNDFGFDIAKNYMLGFLIDLNTQTFPGYAYPEIDSLKISQFLSPGYLSMGLGLTYYKTNKFSIFISPAAFNSEIVSKKLQSVNGDRKTRNSIGALLKMNYNGPIAKNVILKSSLELFSDYLRTPENIEVVFPSTFHLKVNKYLEVKININARYNHYNLVPIFETIDGEKIRVGSGPRLQITETLGIGLSL